MATKPYDEWVQQEQAELEHVHQEHLAKLKGYQEFEKERAAAQAKMHAETGAAMKAQAEKTEKYRQDFLARHKAYARTSSSSRSKL